MNFTSKQIEELPQKLQKIWKGKKKCIICGSKDWAIQSKIFRLDEFKSEIRGEVAAIPLIVISCQKCGFLIQFNAIGLGIVEVDLEKEMERRKDEEKQDSKS